MNKTKAMITVVLALISVLILFSIAKTEDPFTYATASQEQPSTESTVQAEELLEIEPLVEEEDETPIADPLNKALFIDEDYDRERNSIRHTGVIIEKLTQAPLADLDITEYCNNEEVSSGKYATDAEGFFDVVYDCHPGYEAFLSVGFNGLNFDSEHVTMPQKRVKRGGSSAPSASAAKGVPEFSTGTLAIVIVVGCLGIALLRKQ